MNPRIKGLLFILMADLLWALSAITSKFLFNQRVNPFDLAQLRMTLSFIILGLTLVLFRPRLLVIQRKDTGYMLVFGLLGLTAVQLTYLYTISQTNVATAVFLQYLAPVFMLVYAWLTRRGNVNWPSMLALMLALGGGYLMVKGHPAGAGLSVTTRGLISGLVSAVCFAFYTIYGKYGLRKYSPWTLLCWAMGTGTLAWSFYRLPWTTFFLYGPREWCFFFYIAVLATIIPFGLYFKGLHQLTPVVAGITSTMEPVLTGILAFVILGEVLTGWQVAGSVCIVLAVTLLQILPEKHPS